MNFKVETCSFLPKTMKDGSGIERVVLGVMASAYVVDKGGQAFFLLGEEVKHLGEGNADGADGSRKERGIDGECVDGAQGALP